MSSRAGLHSQSPLLLVVLGLLPWGCVPYDLVNDVFSCSGDFDCRSDEVCSNFRCLPFDDQSRYCPPGFAHDGSACVDVDECQTGTFSCPFHATCRNTKGGYECDCPSGYESDGYICIDVDECVTGTPCDQNATCLNTPGSHSCECNDGYEGNGFTCEIDGPCEDGVCWIPGGYFWRGCSPSDGDIHGCASHELPYREIYVVGFGIDQFEVSQAEYAACVDAGACSFPKCSWSPGLAPDHPVVCVDWFDARDYCAWAGKRLPTEAEWEKAARGEYGALFPWGNEEPDCSRTSHATGCSPVVGRKGRHPKGASPYGVQDMASNAAEWVADWFHHRYYEDSPSFHPTGPASGSHRVVRGVSWADGRVAYRSVFDPAEYSTLRGFRCAQ